MKKKNIIFLIAFLALFIYYFMIPVSVFWDSGHYTSYVAIFEGSLPWSSWDIVRGPVFPLMLHFSNIFLGKTTQGLLILTFIFYLIMLLSVKLILDNVLEFKSNKKKNIFYGCVFGFLIIDPIVYGYYHAMLTEFVAMTVSILMCFLSWCWLKVDFNNQKKKYILYSLLFACGTVFSWHLKQPYVSATLFPVIIATFISIFSKRKLKNVVQRLSTLFLCIVALVSSIIVWNKFLSNKSINLDSDRNVTASFGNTLLHGLYNYKNTKGVKNNDLLSKSEQNKLKLSDNYIIFDVKNLDGKVVEQEIIKTDKNGKVSTPSAISFIVKEFFKHPLLVLDSYVTNYLAIADIYPKTTTDGVVYSVDKKLNLNYCHENCSIATRVIHKTSNTMYMFDDARQRVANYEQFNASPFYLRGTLHVVSKVTTNLFKILFVILPFICISSIVSRIRNKKECFVGILNMVLILSIYSFLHVLLHAVTNANIDRYASPAYITAILSVILYIYYLVISHKKSEIKKEDAIESSVKKLTSKQNTKSKKKKK